MYHILTPPKYTSFVPRSRAKVMHEVRFAVDKAFLDDQFGDPGPWFGSGVRFVVLWMSLDNKQGVVLHPFAHNTLLSFLLPSFLFSFLPSFLSDDDWSTLLLSCLFAAAALIWQSNQPSLSLFLRCLVVV